MPMLWRTNGEVEVDLKVAAAHSLSKQPEEGTDDNARWRRGCSESK